MRKIEKLCAYLGELYAITKIDRGEVIYRDIGNGFDFEVSGVDSNLKSFTLYVWHTTKHRQEIVGIYSNIKSWEDLKDVLGYYAFKYKNLLEKICIEREDQVNDD
jgi:hypothetical protein